MTALERIGVVESAPPGVREKKPLTPLDLAKSVVGGFGETHERHSVAVKELQRPRTLAKTPVRLAVHYYSPTTLRATLGSNILFPINRKEKVVGTHNTRTATRPHLGHQASLLSAPWPHIQTRTIERKCLSRRMARPDAKSPYPAHSLNHPLQERCNEARYWFLPLLVG